MTTVIAICGYIGSGKSTVADIIYQKHGFWKLNMSDRLKDAVSVIFGWDRALLNGDTPESREFREAKDEYWSWCFKRDVTPRWALQYFGTEVMRRHLHEDIWIMSLNKVLSRYGRRVVIPDLRFKNEEAFIRNIGGKIIRVERDSSVPVGPLHESELYCPHIKQDVTVKNNGTLLDLEKAVSVAMKEFDL